jgi:hypothetical protein
LFGEGVIVIARGQLRDGKFVVSELGLPPAERRNETLENVNALGVGAAMPDFFGAPWVRLLCCVLFVSERRVPCNRSQT